MKYKLHLTSNVEIPNNTRWVLFYTRKDGQSKVYPLAEILSQNNKFMKAEVIDSGIRTFVNSRILTLNKVD